MNFPLDLRFKLLAIASQIAVTDAQGQLVYYAKQRAFKLKEAVTVFADAASALVGIRWGRRKWFHHEGKTYLGTVGGAVVAVAVALPFVGPAMAVVSGAVFALLDAAAPRPIPVSDNLLNPVGLAIAYTVGWSLIQPMFPYY